MDKKYKLLDKREDEMYNIIALRDIPRHGVKAGDEGGLVSKKHSLSQDGDCWIGYDATVCGDVVVRDNAIIRDCALVNCNAVVCDDAIIRDCACIWGFDHAQTNVGGTAVISGTTHLGSGVWRATPKVIKGSYYDVIYNDEQIAIGCECHPLEWWEENGLEVAKEDGFTHVMIEEYREHLNAIKKEYANG